jgi:hypothetical protein
MPEKSKKAAGTGRMVFIIASHRGPGHTRKLLILSQFDSTIKISDREHLFFLIWPLHLRQAPGILNESPILGINGALRTFCDGLQGAVRAWCKTIDPL